MKKKWWLIPCISAILSLGTMTTVFANSGWTREAGTWVYYNGDGQTASDVMKKSGEDWYYLDYNGNLTYSTLVELNGNNYYMNSAGAMVTNQWREIPNNSSSSDEPDTWWYYFQEDGKAIRGSFGSGRTKFVTIPTSTGEAKFIFDEEGHMLSGWLGEEGDMLTDDEAWREGVYYCGEADDGRVAYGWRYLDAENDDDDRREQESYWFYFKSNGEKSIGTNNKIINGKKYGFGEYGAARFDWKEGPELSTATPSNAYRYYNEETQCWLAVGWFQTVPGEAVDEEAYENDEARWFYADNGGKLVKSRFKTIKGQRYGFKENGVMLYGLYRITFESDNKTIAGYEKIEEEDEIPEGTEENVYVYYFGDSPKEGCMKNGDTNVEIDGEKYRYRFRKSGLFRGAGVDGIDDGSIYIMGRLIKADRDARYETFTYQNEDYLINTSGRIMKDKKNLKDLDDTYYCTDSRGVVTYQGEERK